MNTNMVTTENEYANTAAFYSAVEKTAKARKDEWAAFANRYVKTRARIRFADWLDYQISRAIGRASEKASLAGFDKGFLTAEAVVEALFTAA